MSAEGAVGHGLVLLAHDSHGPRLHAASGRGQKAGIASPLRPVVGSSEASLRRLRSLLYSAIASSGLRGDTLPRPHRRRAPSRAAPRVCVRASPTRRWAANGPGKFIPSLVSFSCCALAAQQCRRDGVLAAASGQVVPAGPGVKVPASGLAAPGCNSFMVLEHAWFSKLSGLLSYFFLGSTQCLGRARRSGDFPNEQQRDGVD